jgi:hypothetical protein
MSHDPMGLHGLLQEYVYLVTLTTWLHFFVITCTLKRSFASLHDTMTPNRMEPSAFVSSIENSASDTTPAARPA